MSDLSLNEWANVNLWYGKKQLKYQANSVTSETSLCRKKQDLFVSKPNESQAAAVENVFFSRISGSLICVSEWRLAIK